jgi:hypothetical protein
MIPMSEPDPEHRLLHVGVLIDRRAEHNNIAVKAPREYGLPPCGWVLQESYIIHESRLEDITRRVREWETTWTAKRDFVMSPQDMDKLKADTHCSYMI